MNVIRVRHHTFPTCLKLIRLQNAINSSRSGGIDVELEPFGTTQPGYGGPKAETGAFGEGAYIEFDAFPNSDKIILTSHIGPRNTATIITSVPLLLSGRNPDFITRSWWLRLWDNLWGR